MDIDEVIKDIQEVFARSVRTLRWTSALPCLKVLSSHLAPWPHRQEPGEPPAVAHWRRSRTYAEVLSL